jgi:hypothetical protein
MKVLKNKVFKTVLIVVLVVLILGSTAMFVFALTRPGTGEDPKDVKLSVDITTEKEIQTCAYKVYGDDSQPYWVAKTVFKNTGKIPARDLTIRYKVGDYSEWTQGEPYPEVLPGQTVRDFCWPVFKPEMMDKVTTKTPVELTMTYEYRGLDKPVEQHEKLYLLGKNDYISSTIADEEQIEETQGDEEAPVTYYEWKDNYRFIAAFVTPNDETTKSFAELATGGLAPKASDEEARTALLKIFDTMRVHGVRYVHEPQSYWSSKWGQYVQYPNETINRKAGTCLDLAVCVAGMTSALGLDSYVVFVPGHAFPMIELPDSGDLLPIESTMVDDVEMIIPAEYAIDSAIDTYNENKDAGKLLSVYLQACWKNGIMPSR